MKPVSRNLKEFVAAIALITVCCFFISWQTDRQDPVTFRSSTDTLPKKKKVVDLDEAIAELEATDISRELEKAMAEVDKAMKELDEQEISLKLQEALNRVNMEEVRAQVDMAIKDIDVNKINREVEESLAKIDWENIKSEMDGVKMDFGEIEEELKKVKEEMKGLKPKLEKQLNEARLEIEKAKTQLKQYRDFLNGLEKDGLIDTKKDYEVKHAEGKLYINGKEVPGETYEKYRDFLENHKQFTIKKERDDFNVDL